MSISNNNINEASRLLLGTPTPDVRERERETETSRRFRTLLHLLNSDKSDAGDDYRTNNRWRAFKERLGFSLAGCCGSGAWPRRSSSPPPTATEHGGNGVMAMNVVLQEEEEEEQAMVGGGMNLAEALAAEREFRLVASEEGAGTPERVSLMRLLEVAEREREAKEAEEEKQEEERENEVGNERVCCVCMVRKKGAAMIPCGHTFCRICSKQVWINRGCCPLCNGLIVDVLNIF